MVHILKGIAANVILNLLAKERLFDLLRIPQVTKILKGLLAGIFGTIWTGLD